MIVIAVGFGVLEEWEGREGAASSAGSIWA